MMYETYELSRKEWGIYGAEGILGIAVLDYVFLPECGTFSGIDAGWNTVSSYVEKAVEEKAAGDPAGAV